MTVEPEGAGRVSRKPDVTSEKRHTLKTLSASNSGVFRFSAVLVNSDGATRNLLLIYVYLFVILAFGSSECSLFFLFFIFATAWCRARSRSA